MWTEHRNPEGRTYWFNTGTRESVWEKPDGKKTCFGYHPRALGQTKWKEYFSGGRKYYYNTDSKESKWDMPDELLLLLEKVEKEGPGNALVPASAAKRIPSVPAPLAIAAPNQGALVVAGTTPQANGTDGTVALQGNGLPFTPTSVLPVRPNLPEDPVIPHNGFLTVEEGEKAFMHLLRKAGVDADWTWDQTMRTIITDPLYKALNTLAEKKAAWQKYIEALQAKEHEEREARLSKLRPALRNMLKGNPNVFHYTTFVTADKLFSQHPIWQQGKIEAERKLIFEEYVAELKQREVQETRAARSRSINKVVALFKQLDVDVLTRWRKAHELVLDTDEWQNDAELQKLPTLDILLAFEDYSRVKEREFEEQMRRAQVEKTRKERKAREGFRALLQELVDAGKIKARTKWRQIYSAVANDERYLSILGNPGSNPLELFWDTVDQLDQKLDAKIALAEESIRKTDTTTPMVEDGVPDAAKSSVVTPETTFEDFCSMVRRDPDSNMSDGDLHMVFDSLHEQALKKQSDERRRLERKQRHLQDDLRYALKKMPEPLDLNMTFELASANIDQCVVPLIEHLPEYKAIEEEEHRRAAFVKFVKRQKERMREAASEDGASTTSRKRKEPPRDDKERDRDRDRDSYRDKPRDYDRDKEKESRSSRHHHRAQDDDSYTHTSRDHGRDREKDYGHSRGDRDREREHRSRHGRDERDERDERRRARRSPRPEHGHSRTWDEAPPHDGEDEPTERGREKRDRSRDTVKPKTRDTSAHADRVRAEKRPRYDHETDDVKEERRVEKSLRAETPEEGEI
ncbi:hypothetical protein BJ138DRAFT_1133828 [Hygrophoropsis aurantiaca]|uniref:Uncharacterized protein n=1 Tax=Hygrophoropsis aurantiaca TaxID=72124 RepID=A0ACB8AKT9_9AGAM|nr:hypothetical protein BJ138DRAFT_1133828 [Hygrophoropsis aurantiaca]